MAIETLPEPSIPVTTPFRPGLGFLTSTPIIAAATVCLVLVILSAIFAPFLSPHDPLLLAPAQRLKPASAQFLLGTDAYGRDVLSRILYGGRISLLIGLGAAVASVAVGLIIGLVSGFFRWIDAVLARDYPVIQAMILLTSGIYVAVNLLIDLAYTLLDPRIRY